MPKSKAETILTSFELPAKEAIKILKGQDVDTSGDWEAMMAFSGDRAFVISHVVNADILQDMLDGLTKALEEGTPFEEFKKNARDLLARRGWTGADADDEAGQTADLTEAWRLELIYRNNLQNALNAGRRTGQLNVMDRRPYSVYSSVRDNHTTDECKGRDGVVLPTDDAWWDKNYPQNHHLCRGKVYTASERELTRDGLKISTDEYLATLPPPAKGFAQSPLDSYKPDTKKYAEPLRKQVDEVLAKKPKKVKV